MAVSVMHRMDLGCSEDTVCPRRCCTFTVGHRAGCPLGGHHRHGQRDFLHLVLPVGKAESPGSLEKHNMLCYGKQEQGQGVQQTEILSSFRASLHKAGQPLECLCWSYSQGGARAWAIPRGHGLGAVCV